MIKTYSIDQLFKTRWEDLTPQEMITMIELSDRIHRYESNSVEYGLCVIEVLKTLRINKSAVAKINEEQALDCFLDITFFRRDDKGSFSTPWYFFPVGNFKSNGIDFFCPEVMDGLPLFNRSFDQLVYADAAFSGFCVLNHQVAEIRKDIGDRPASVLQQMELKQLEQEMSAAVNKLVAVLYQNPPFDLARTERDAKLIDLKLTNPQRALILNTYANVRSFITHRCPCLFHINPTEEESDAAPEHTGAMWLNIRYDLSETKAFAGLHTARNANIYDAIDYLEKKAYEAAEQKRNTDQG